jgi:hypothetical protein
MGETVTSVELCKAPISRIDHGFVFFKKMHFFILSFFVVLAHSSFSEEIKAFYFYLVVSYFHP